VNQVVEYELALKTLRCYCQIHGYELISVNILKQREEEEKEELDEGCTQKDVGHRIKKEPII
jgi:hypothetical protein